MALLRKESFSFFLSRKNTVLIWNSIHLKLLGRETKKKKKTRLSQRKAVLRHPCSVTINGKKDGKPIQDFTVLITLPWNLKLVSVSPPKLGEVDRRRRPGGSLSEPRADEEQPVGGEGKVHPSVGERGRLIVPFQRRPTDATPPPPFPSPPDPRTLPHDLSP